MVVKLAYFGITDMARSQSYKAECDSSGAQGKHASVQIDAQAYKTSALDAKRYVEPFMSSCSIFFFCKLKGCSAGEQERSCRDGFSNGCIGE